MLVRERQEAAGDRSAQVHGAKRRTAPYRTHTGKHTGGQNPPCACSGTHHPHLTISKAFDTNWFRCIRFHQTQRRTKNFALSDASATWKRFMLQYAQRIQELVATQEWSGPASDLAAELSLAPEVQSPSAPRLAIWLRRNEPTLWWDYGIRVRFSRTGRQRLVHLSRRDQLSAVALSYGDG